MLGAWTKLATDTAMLSLEAQTVIEMRLTQVALGRITADELQLMVTEKVAALFEATRTIGTGGSAETVVDSYRKHVQANATRLRLLATE